MSAIMSDKWVPLMAWAKDKYPITPHINTLRNWVNNGRIHPRPQKMGRGWYVRPHAEYRSD